MSCLRIDQIYLYLEKELSGSEKKIVETHLQSCTTCHEAFKERQTLNQAISHFPLWEPPENFAKQVISRLFPERISFRSWLTAMCVGISSVVLTLFLAYVLSGQNLGQLLLLPCVDPAVGTLGQAPDPLQDVLHPFLCNPFEALFF